MDAPSEPIVFMKATSSINGPNDDIEISKDSKELDWEVELGIIIGKDAKNINEKEAESHILGYCLVNDVSEREWQLKKMGQWVKGKSHDTYGPIGPYLVTKSEISNINSLNLSLDVNGQRMQTGNTDKMIFNVFFIVSYLSKFMTLQPAKNITNCIFGGLNNNDIFVSTALKGMNKNEIKKYKFSGSLFKIKTNIKGIQPKSFKI